MSASQYTYITLSYHLVVFPNRSWRDPDWNHYRIISTLLSLAPNHLYSPIGTKVAKFIHRNHQFESRAYPDTPVDLVVIIDINLVNSSPVPFYNFARSIKTNIPTYYLQWDMLPSAIPPYLYSALISHHKLNNIVPDTVLKAFETWFTLLLLTQNNLALHLREPRAPTLPEPSTHHTIVLPIPFHQPPPSLLILWCLPNSKSQAVTLTEIEWKECECVGG